MEILSKFILPGVFLLLTLAFGFWLSHTGKPYNGLLFNIHKLLALGVVILAVVQFSKIIRLADASALLIGLLALAAICIVALFASGALMSMEKLEYALTLTIHRIALALLVVALGWAFYLLEAA